MFNVEISEGLDIEAILGLDLELPNSIRKRLVDQSTKLAKIEDWKVIPTTGREIYEAVAPENANEACYFFYMLPIVLRSLKAWHKDGVLGMVDVLVNS